LIEKSIEILPGPIPEEKKRRGNDDESKHQCFFHKALRIPRITPRNRLMVEQKRANFMKTCQLISWLNFW